MRLQPRWKQIRLCKLRSWCKLLLLCKLLSLCKPLRLSLWKPLRQLRPPLANLRRSAK